MWKSNSGISVPLSDIKASFINWLQSTGESTKSAKDLELKKLSGALINVLKTTFGHEVRVARQRLTSESGRVRPYCLFGVKTTDGFLLQSRLC